MRHIILDMDGTVTESRSIISPKMKKELESLSQDVVIISGAALEQMEKQLDGLKCEVMAQNGNDSLYWQRNLTLLERMKINAHIRQFSTLDERTEDRGCQVSYSFTGHDAPRNTKVRFDPTQRKRRAILEKHPPPDRIVVKIAGTTCLDYFGVGCDKGSNIRRLLRKKKWHVKDCLYIGDALYTGGNDETVQGVIPTLQIKSPVETLAFLKTL